ncbi:recombinase family protein [Blastococcus sp. VKM Ac-2987]|uniref:recombinase family protein n=1 Tax=Blastococcus sp. VKM Ac-2987 TaxID=3004141 RepID=UPI0022AB58C7|nr:recombinase family protein [Blastococcus sp. VKM Ac-2987]MCZ2857821.1 recombinase family protein [Blastococcus sp. VKM Ac-2987]
MRVVAYVRVSTREQAEDGHGLDAQRAEITRTAEARGWSIVAWGCDAGVSGAHLDGRDGWSRAIELVESGQADGIVATKIDRVSRSVADFAALVSRAKEHRWNLVVLDIGLDLSTPTGEFVATIMCAAAQLERRMVGQRTKDGLAAAKAKGVRLGRPVVITDDVARRVAELRATGATLAEIADQLTDDGVPTAGGGDRWWPSTVRGVLARSA